MPSQATETLSWEPFFQKISTVLRTSRLNYFAGSLSDTPRKRVALLVLPSIQVFISVTCLVGMIRPNKYDVDDKISCLIIFFTECSIFMKFLTLIYHNELLKTINDTIVSATDCRRVEPWEQALAEKYHRIAGRVCFWTWFLYFLTMICFTAMPLFSKKDYMMPILMEIPGTNQSSHPGYEINYILGSYSVYYGTVIQLGCDVPVFLQAYFIAFQLDRCSHYCQLIGDFDSAYNTNDKQSELIVKCIKLQRDIMQFAKSVGSINSLVVALLFITGSPIVTVSLLSAFSGTIGIGSVMMSASTYNLFMYCFLGEMVFTKFREVSAAIYSSKWNNITRLDDRRTFLLFLTLSQKEVFFSAGGLCRLSLETFTETMKRVYGFCAFLNEVI